MRTPEHPSQPQIKTYTIELPADVSPDALQDLGAMAAVYGGVVVDASADTLTMRHLESVSEDLWGDPIYGRAADLYLDSCRQALHVEHNIYRGSHTYRFDSSDPWNHPAYGRWQKTTEPQTNDQIQAWIRDEWDIAAVPYELVAKPDKEGGFVVGAGPLSKRRLQSWVVGDAKHQHQLHGSLGKALDVLGVASGVVDPGLQDLRSRDIADDFMDYQEFTTRVRKSGLTRSQKAVITEKIDDELQWAIRSPLVVTERIVVEGAVTRRDGQRNYTHIVPQMIALSSIPRIAELYRNTDVVRERLQQIFPEL